MGNERFKPNTSLCCSTRNLTAEYAESAKGDHERYERARNTRKAEQFTTEVTESTEG